MKRIITLLATCLAALVAAPSYAGETTVLMGVTQFQPHEDGTWYQKAFPYQLNMTSGSMGLRYDTTPDQSGLSYSVGYMHLGIVTSSAIATSIDGKVPGDNGYNPAIQACNGDCGYLSHWYGHGSVQGVFGSIVKSYGPWSIEAGLYLYKPTWSVNIPDFVDLCRTCPSYQVTVGHEPIMQVGPMLGLRYRKDQWSLNLSMWQTQSHGDHWPSLYTGQSYNLSLGYSF